MGYEPGGLPRPMIVTLAVDIMFVIALLGFGWHAIALHHDGITVLGWFTIAAMGLIHTGVTIGKLLEARRLLKARQEFERRFGL